MLAREGAARGKAGRVCLRGGERKGKGRGKVSQRVITVRLQTPIPLVAADSRFGDWGLRAFIA